MNTSRGAKTNSDNLRIMIVSTPKTGNTWVKHLLAHVYDLPLVSLGMAFDADEIAALGPRWITHQHYAALEGVIACAERHNVVLVTTIRHPCDALVSMFHFVRSLGPRLVFADVDRAPVMAQDGDQMGEHTLSYVLDGYATSLDISLGWMRSGLAHLVRYEDLKRDPVSAVRGLTDSICAVSLDRIERAIEECDIDRMRAKPGFDPSFFRRGEVGGWRSELSQEILHAFRHEDPYPAQFAELGYSLDEDWPVAPPPERSLETTARRPSRPSSLARVESLARIDSHFPIAWPDWPPGIGAKTVALAQKVVRRLLCWYIDPIVEQQNEFNAAVDEALHELWREVAHLKEQLPREDRHEE